MSDGANTLNVDGFILREYMTYFAGSDTHYGVTTLGPVPKEGEKREAKVHTSKGDPGPTQYAEHLNGKVGLGIAPLMNKEFLRFAAIDVDVYDLGLRKRIVDAVRNGSLPICIALSKSGGMHMYVFFQEPERAEDVRAVLFEISSIFALDYAGKAFNATFDKTEIFPKQNVETAANGSNWINLPYFDYTNTARPMLSSEGEPLNILDAFTLIKDNVTTLKALKLALAQIPGSDGPPCLQHIRLFNDLKDGDGRNNYIFSLARYFKLSNSNDTENELLAANAALNAPIPENELRSTLNSAIKTDASYLCQKTPLCDLCARKLCNLREFGVGNVAVSNFSFGQLTIIMSDPPVYRWIIDEQPFEFYDESDILEQRTWQRMAMRKLHKAPRILKADTWLTIVNRALENKIVEYPEAGLGNSAGELLMAHVTDFLLYRGRAQELSLVPHGAVYVDTFKNLVMFRMEALFKYLKNQNISFLSVAQLGNKLANDFGAKSQRVYHNPIQFRCWTLPLGVLGPWMKAEGEDVDFEALAAKAATSEDF